MVFDAPDAFEKFARSIARDGVPDATWRLEKKQEWSFVAIPGQSDHTHIPDILLSALDGKNAVGDAKYKEVLQGAAGEWLGNAEEALKVGIQAADWNQLYVYMRMKHASSGFFVVPFWRANGESFVLREGIQFIKTPCDGPVRVAVLALNLLRPLAEVKKDAAATLRTWLSVTTS